MSTTNICTLPNELLLQIAEDVTRSFHPASLRDAFHVEYFATARESRQNQIKCRQKCHLLFALGLINRRFHALFEPLLYEFAVAKCSPWAFVEAMLLEPSASHRHAYFNSMRYMREAHQAGNTVRITPVPGRIFPGWTISGSLFTRTIRFPNTAITRKFLDAGMDYEAVMREVVTSSAWWIIRELFRQMPRPSW